MIKILIVEDEIPAQINLKKLIDRCCPEGSVVMTLTSVRQTVKWLEENPEGADVIFMDVELSDGICFEIQCSSKYPNAGDSANSREKTAVSDPCPAESAGDTPPPDPDK